MNIPPQTSDIFQYLSQGHFISLNSRDPMQVHLYEVISHNEHSLQEYFAAIDLYLHRGHGYFYFSRMERRDNRQEQFGKVMRQLDLLHFLLALNPAFGPGYTFSIQEVWDTCRDRQDLLQLLDNIHLRPAAASHEEKVRQLFQMMERDTFLEAESDAVYRVLSAFDYLLQLLDRIELDYDRHTQSPNP